ncbi:sulfite exporter TauE/SafE family protein [Paralcaligenes sp. KSB-10]|jgi:uncharacterized membrane protein YfcA|uniref:sulfite exporter TauE/SafE family protein n=1 Tax=Paralcaligenes sp. KSB-10 TaxID=2901142 RepID=UPI001E61D040|nr:sulfite exporter TauE/SafE family protein [Paralcaligenes sp. KSB-10]UHL64633.1 sulfite exporter TauE/SafE family protein [Paralcaligenes sp. KSB-10]
MSEYQVISGFVVGLLVGVTGVGGGSLMTPLLTLVFGYAPTVAVGTDLAFAALTKGAGTLAHGIHGQVRWPVVRRLCLGSLPAAVMALLCLRYVGSANETLLQFIKITIAVSVLLTVMAIALRPRLLAFLRHCSWYPLQGRGQKLATIAVGAVLGALVTISSIGAGAVGATLIFLLYPTLKPSEIVGTDIAYAVPLTALAALGHLWLGHVHWDLLGALLLGSVPGIWLGARLSRTLPERMVRLTLATTLTLVALRLIA